MQLEDSPQNRTPRHGGNALILVDADPANTGEVIQRLGTIAGPGVHAVWGPHDVVVDLEADTQENITAILQHKIRPIKGITNTVTCIWC